MRPRSKSAGNRAVIYARVSTKKQEKKGLSLPGQIERCRKKAAEEGYEVSRIFREAESASEEAEKRPAFQDAIAYALDKGNSIGAFVVYDSSRFARRREDAATYKAILRRRGISILYVEHAIDDSNDDDLFIEGIFELMDERYSRTLGKLALRGMADNARKGYFNGGALPLGYQWEKIRVGDTKKLTLKPDPKYAPVVEQVFRMVLDGHGCKAIAQTMNREGIRLPSGSEWKSSIVSRLLKNVRYKGWSRFVAGDEELVVENTHPPIVDPQTWDQVQTLLASRRPFETGRINPKRTVAYTGILFCGQCKSALVATTGTGKKGKLYHYYSCSGRHNGGDCPGIRLNATAFDEALTGFLADRFFGPAGIDRLFASLRAFVEEHNAETARQKGAIAAQIAEVETRISRIYDALESGAGFDPDDLAPRIAQLRKSQRELREKAEGLVTLQMPEDSEGARKRLGEFLKGVLHDCGVETRIRMLRGMGIRVFVWEDRLEIKANPSRILSSSSEAREGFAESSQWRAKPERQANPAYTARYQFSSRGGGGRGQIRWSTPSSTPAATP